MTPDDDKSLGDGSTFSGHVNQSRSDMSLGDERTISGGDAAGLDTVLDDIEIDDLGARYKIERPLGEGGMRAGHCELRKQYQENRGGNYKRPAQVGLHQP